MTCGTWEWQWGDEGHDPDLEVDASICFGCEQLEIRVKRDEKGPTVHGRKYGMYPREV